MNNKLGKYIIKAFKSDLDPKTACKALFLCPSLDKNIKFINK